MNKTNILGTVFFSNEDEWRTATERRGASEDILYIQNYKLTLISYF